MNKQAGLWIDHKKAVIAVVTGRRVSTHLAISNVERQLRRTGSSPLKGSFDDFEVPADDVRKRAYMAHLNVYYDTVIAGLGDAESVLIMGPGEAKHELKNRMARSRLGRRIAAVEPADKMTSVQIAKHVKDFFTKK